MKNALRAILALLSMGAAAILDAMGGDDSLAGALVAAMCIDYFTGFICAAVWHRSPKTESGRAQSRAGIKGYSAKWQSFFVSFLRRSWRSCSTPRDPGQLNSFLYL